MRAVVERNTASGTDAWGNPAAPSFAALATYACFVWSSRAREIRDGDKTAEIEELRVMFPLGTDIQAGDEISSVQDRRGATLIAGRLRIEAPPVRKHRHIEAPLRRVA